MGLSADFVDLMQAGRVCVSELTKVRSCAALMSEFLRRESLWVSALGIKSDFPFADLASALARTPIDATEYLQSIRDFAHSTAEMRCCMMLAKWGILEHRNPACASRFPLPPPYEPVMKFFRRGGWFDQEHRVFIGINSVACVHAAMICNQASDIPALQMSDDNLDVIDRSSQSPWSQSSAPAPAS